MKLVSLTMKNFRCYAEETKIYFDDLTTIIGANDIGKSSILDALDVFFNNNIDGDDFYVDNKSKMMELICEFDDLPKNIKLDASVETDLKSEYLLNSNNNLVIAKKYKYTKNPKEIVSIKACYPKIPGKYNNIHSLTISKLKEILKEIDYDGYVDLRVASDLRKAIIKHYITIEHVETTDMEIHLDKEVGKDIYSALKSYFPVYSVFQSDRKSLDKDTEIQDPLKTAIGEALKSDDIRDKLNEVNSYVKEKVKGVTERTIENIKESNLHFMDNIDPLIPDADWNKSYSKVSLMGERDIPFNKRGSGVRRLVLFNFFRAQVDFMENTNNSSIYAIEEPETALHPKTQEQFFELLCELPSKGRQIIITTHNTNMISQVRLDSIRYIRNGGVKREIESVNENNIGLLCKDLGIFKNTKIKLFIVVEGVNDRNCLLNISDIIQSNKDSEEFLDLRRAYEGDEVLILISGGSNINHYASSKIEKINIPIFCLLDSDKKKEDEKSKYCKSEEALSKMGATVVHTEKREMENYIHPRCICKYFEIDNDALTIDDNYENIPELVASKLHEKNGSKKAWSELEDKKKKEKESKIKKKINEEVCKTMKYEQLLEVDKEKEVKGWFKIMKSLYGEA